MSSLTEPQFLDERVAHWAATKPDEEAVTYLSRSWTWSQWDDRVRRLAGALAARGVGRGDVVAFLDKNHPACVELTLAAASLGAANAIINFRLAADELDYVINDSGAKLLFVGKLDGWEGMKPGIPAGLPCISLPTLPLPSRCLTQEMPIPTSQRVSRLVICRASAAR